MKTCMEYSDGQGNMLDMTIRLITKIGSLYDIITGLLDEIGKTDLKARYSFNVTYFEYFKVENYGLIKAQFRDITILRYS